MSATIGTTTSIAPLYANGHHWRNRILKTSDNYRVVVYSDGSNLVVRTSATGATWSAATTLISCVTAMNDGIDCCICGDQLIVINGGGTSYRVPYSGSGAWGAAVSLGSGIGASAGSRVVADPSAAPSVGNTGVFHVVTDASHVTINAYDAHGSGSVLATLTNLGGSNTIRSGATSAILRTTGNLLVVYFNPGTSYDSLIDVVVTYALVGSTPTYSKSSGSSIAKVGQSGYGTAMMLAANSSTPDVDLLFQGGGYGGATGGLVRRYWSGGYSSPATSISDSNSIGACSSATTAATEGIFGLQAFSGTNHVGARTQSGGVWSSVAQRDSSATAVQQFIVPQNGAADTFGQSTIVYENGASSPYTLNYDDAGFVGGATTPTAAVALTPGNPTAAYPDVTGTGPYTTTNTKPWFGVTMTESLSTDKLGAYEIIVKNGGTTLWDSGKVGVASGPTSGTPYAVQYGGSAISGANLNVALTVTCYVWDAVGNLQSALSSAVNFVVIGAPTLASLSPTSVTSPSEAFQGAYTQAQSLAATAIEAQILDSGGNALLDTGASAISTASGGTAVAASLTLVPPLTNGTSYTLSLAITTQPTIAGGYPAIAVAYTATITLALTPAPTPTNLAAFWIPGDSPLDGGYVQLSFDQPSGTPEAAGWLLYERADDDDAAIPVNATQFASSDGNHMLRYWSAGNNATLQLGLASVSALGVISAIAWTTLADSIAFARGLWINEVYDPMTGSADPSRCVELGRYQYSSGGTYPYSLERLDNVQQVEFMNRGAYQVNRSDLGAKHTPTNNTPWVLPAGYEPAMKALLDTWRANNATVQFRDPWGNVFLGKILHGPTEGAIDRFGIQTILIEILQSDSFAFNLIASL